VHQFCVSLATVAYLCVLLRLLAHQGTIRGCAFHPPTAALFSRRLHGCIFYNNERPHQGYRNCGKRPVDTVKEFVKIVNEDG
jgi:hypothetical protein